MASSNGPRKKTALRMLEELPGIGDVVWATVTRLASERATTRVLFTAAEKSAGTTLLASATAVGLAQHERVPVCLIETNLARPAMAAYLGLERVGLSDILDGRAELEDCLQEPQDCRGLLVLTAGTPRAAGPGEFATESMIALLARLASRCPYLVLDTAPVLEHVETRFLLRHADAALLVLRARATRRSDAERAHDILIESGTTVLGSIFNAFQRDGLFNGSTRANRRFRRAVRAERARTSEQPSSIHRKAPSIIGSGVAPDTPLVGQEPTNGRHFIDVAPLPAEGSEAAHAHQIDLLERRIAKLTRMLEQTEADLMRVGAMKDVDVGFASIYRGVQGLSSREDALVLKRSLMRDIFEANLELKTAMARHS